MMVDMNIVAMGGGSVGLGETRALDQTLLDLTGKAQPHVLFIPTASCDDPEYVKDFTQAYAGLGCTVSSLLLDSGDDPSKIEAADVIYVGGGNTKRMIALWKSRGVDRLLRAHLEAGKPAGGLSAGAICWFRVGNSDWPQYEDMPGVNTARLDALGFVDLVLCPHTRDEGFRLGDFREMMRGEQGAGVGLDDCCAIQIRGSEYRILASQEGAVAHRIQWVEGALLENNLAPHEDFRPISHLKDSSNWR
jgi:dipeptidase E